MQNSNLNFQKKICPPPQNSGDLEFFEFLAKIAKHKNALILKTVRERA